MVKDADAWEDEWELVPLRYGYIKSLQSGCPEGDKETDHLYFHKPLLHNHSALLSPICFMVIATTRYFINVGNCYGTVARKVKV